MKSLLFVPANKKDRFNKALNSGASNIIIDLEDAVNHEDKPLGRQNILDFYNENPQVKFIVRINDCASPYFNDDLLLLQKIPNLTAVMLPKAQYKQDFEQLIELNFKIIPIIETALGVYNLKQIASTKNIMALSFGALDMRLDLDLSSGLGEDFMLNHIRANIVIATKVNNLMPALNGVYPNIKNIEGLKNDLIFAKSLGFGGSLCIHPAQVETINNVFSYSKDEIEWANIILDLAKKHENRVFEYAGKMIDLPVILLAQKIIAKSNV